MRKHHKEQWSSWSRGLTAWGHNLEIIKCADEPASPGEACYDQPDRPLAFESFINVDEPDQWADFAALAEQEEFLLIFYDEALHHRLTKQVRNTAGEQMRNILNWADRVRASIPDEQYDFDQAKADVMRRTRL